MFRKLCGESTLKSVALVANIWGEASRDVCEAFKKELSSEFFKLALDKGAQMARHYDTGQSAHDITLRILDNHPVVSQINRELADERERTANTTTGKTVNRELYEQIRQSQSGLKKVREEISVKEHVFTAAISVRIACVPADTQLSC